IRCSTSAPRLYSSHAVIGSMSRLVRIVAWYLTSTLASGSSPSAPRFIHRTPSIRTPHRSPRETSTPASSVFSNRPLKHCSVRCSVIFTTKSTPSSVSFSIIFARKNPLSSRTTIPLHLLEHLPPKDPLVEPHHDPPPPLLPQPRDQLLQPLLRSGRRVRLSRPPLHPQAVARVQERQQRVVRGAPVFLRVVADLRPRLLHPVAHVHRRVQRQLHHPRHAAHRLPPRLHHLPQHFVARLCTRSPHPSHEAPEAGRVHHPLPPRQRPHSPALQQWQVVHAPASVRQQRDPLLRMQRRTVPPPHLRQLPVQIRPDLQLVPQRPQPRQPRSVRQHLVRELHVDRGRITLYVRTPIHTFHASTVWV